MLQASNAMKDVHQELYKHLEGSALNVTLPVFSAKNNQIIVLSVRETCLCI